MTRCLLTLCLLFAAQLLAAQANPDADRAAEEQDQARALGALVIRSLEEAKALPTDVAAVYSLCKLDDGVLAELKKRPSLKTLSLSQWVSAEAWVTDASLDIIAGFPALETLRLQSQSKLTSAGLGKLARLKTLKHLGLVYCNPMDVSALSAFKKHPALSSLAINTQIGPPVMEALAAIPELKRLDLNGVADRVDNPLKGLEKCKKLEHFGIGGATLGTIPMDTLSKVKLLKSLSVAERGILEWTDDMLGVIGKLKTLENLEIHAQAMICTTSAKGFEKLHTLKALKTLDLTWDFNKTLTHEALAKWLAALPALVDLRLRYVAGTNIDVVAALALKRLVFHCAGVTDQAFTDTLAKATSLEHLDFKADGLTDTVVLDALMAAPSLKTVIMHEEGQNLVNVPYRLAEDKPDLVVTRNPR